MPTNKNAMLRYKILDDLLSSKYHNYTLDELTVAVNDCLCERSPDTGGVTRRQIEKDLNFMEDALGAVIESYPSAVYDWDKGKTVRRLCKRYAKKGYTIFNKELTADEEYILTEVLSLLGQFDGLPDFDGLEKLCSSFDVKTNRKIVSIAKSPLAGSNMFGRLFTAISQRQVIEVSHCPFGEGVSPSSYILHPYMLKEYNRRWYLIAMTERDGKIRNFGLDRIIDVRPLSDCKYIPYDGDIEERFEDVVGVTVMDGKETEEILFWVSDVSKEYVVTKPIHDSQILYKGTKEAEFRDEFPNLVGGGFFSICCKENYELLRELTSFGEHLIVLRPISMRNKVIERIRRISQAYDISEDNEQRVRERNIASHRKNEERDA